MPTGDPDFDEDEDTCRICLCPLADLSLYEEQSRLLRPSVCKHYYHADCLLSAVASGTCYNIVNNDQVPFCPTCKKGFRTCFTRENVTTNECEMVLRIDSETEKSMQGPSEMASSPPYDFDDGQGVFLLGVLFTLASATQEENCRARKRRRQTEYEMKVKAKCQRLVDLNLCAQKFLRSKSSLDYEPALLNIVYN